MKNLRKKENGKKRIIFRYLILYESVLIPFLCCNNYLFSVLMKNKMGNKTSQPKVIIILKIIHRNYLQNYLRK